MKILAKVVLIAALIIILAATSGHATTTRSSATPVVILFVESASRSQIGALVTSVGGEITREFTIINGVAALLSSLAIQELERNPLVVSVDQDVEVKATDAAANSQIHADQVRALGFTGAGIRLAILDTGIATTHPEFAGRIVLCHTEVAGTATCEDDNGHGTHVAGIAGAQGVNAAARGVAPSVLLMSDKVLNSAGSGTLAQLIAGIQWAVTNNARIISMSLATSPVDGGGTQPNCDGVFPTLTTAVNNAIAANVVVVAAAGNSGTSGLGAPGCISSVIAVGAVDNTDAVASFSSRGVALQDHGVAAPGVNIFSTWLNGGYATLSGTSMATPMVSGTMALMLNRNPSQNPAVVRITVFSDSDCVQAPCPNINIGHGRVNALRAANANNIVATVPLSCPSTTGCGPFGVAFNPANGFIYVTNISSNTVSVIDGSTNTVVATISGFSNPRGITYNPANNRLYVANHGSKSVSVIDPSTNRIVTTIKTGIGGGPDGVAYNSVNRNIYVACGFADLVSVIDSTTNKVMARIRVGDVPSSVAFNPANSRVYITNVFSNTVSVIDSSTNNVVATITGFSSPEGIAFNQINNNMYVANEGSDTVSVINSFTNVVVATIGGFGGPNMLIFNHANGNMYVTNHRLNVDTVSVIVTTTNLVGATITGFDGPLGIGYDSTNRNMYVTNLFSENPDMSQL